MAESTRAGYVPHIVDADRPAEGDHEVVGAVARTRASAEDLLDTDLPF